MTEVTEINSSMLSTLFEEHYTELCRYSYTIIKRQVEAEDVIQKLFMKLWEKRNSIGRIQNIRAYLYRSAHNMSINEQKKLNRISTSTEINKLSIRSNNDTSSTIQTQELETKIQRAMHQLPEKCREVFRLSRFEQLSYLEISERLDISKKTVENQIGKALKIMRGALEDYIPLLLLTALLLDK